MAHRCHASIPAGYGSPGKAYGHTHRVPRPATTPRAVPGHCRRVCPRRREHQGVLPWGWRGALLRLVHRGRRPEGAAARARRHAGPRHVPLRARRHVREAVLRRPCRQGRPPLQPAGRAGAARHFRGGPRRVVDHGRVAPDDGRPVRGRRHERGDDAGGDGGGGEQRARGGLQRRVSVRPGRRDSVHVRPAARSQAGRRGGRPVRAADARGDGSVCGGERADPRGSPAAAASGGAGCRRPCREREPAPGAGDGARLRRCPAAGRRTPWRARSGAGVPRRARRRPPRRRPPRHGRASRVRVEGAPAGDAVRRSGAPRRHRGDAHAPAARRHGDSDHAGSHARTRRPHLPADRPPGVPGPAEVLRRLYPRHDRVQLRLARSRHGPGRAAREHPLSGAWPGVHQDRRGGRFARDGAGSGQARTDRLADLDDAAVGQSHLAELRPVDLPRAGGHEFGRPVRQHGGGPAGRSSSSRARRCSSSSRSRRCSSATS